MDELKLHEIALTGGAVLETGCVCIVPLIESLALPDEIAAAANPKSSTGRLDVFTRVIADETRGFDRIPRGYHGPLYAEISPRTFPVLVRRGSRLSQIRFRQGHALLDGEALRALHGRERLVDDDHADVNEGIAVSVDLSGRATEPAPCSKCARARCRSSSSMARLSAGWCLKKCRSGRERSTASGSARTIRRSGSSCQNTFAPSDTKRRPPPPRPQAGAASVGAGLK